MHNIDLKTLYIYIYIYIYMFSQILFYISNQNSAKIDIMSLGCLPIKNLSEKKMKNRIQIKLMARLGGEQITNFLYKHLCAYHNFCLVINVRSTELKYLYNNMFS